MSRPAALGKTPVSVLVSVGFSFPFATVRGAARIVPHGRSVNTDVFAVVHFGARGCKTGCRDFKSPAYAIPPPGPGMAKLSYQIACGNMSRMELLASRRGWSNANAAGALQAQN